MNSAIIARLDRWIAVFGKPMAPGGANPDNDMIYLLRDAREALSKAERMFKDFAERSADDLIEIKRQRDDAESRATTLAAEAERMREALDKMQRSRDRYRKALRGEDEARAIIKAFMACPELSDCDPRDKDAETLALESRALRFLNRAAPAPGGWRNVSDDRWRDIASAPKDGRAVIVYYENILGKPRKVIAMFAPKYGVEQDPEADLGEYDEANDRYCLPEGWYEVIDNWDEFTWVAFDREHVPTHWRPLPANPSTQELRDE